MESIKLSDISDFSSDFSDLFSDSEKSENKSENSEEKSEISDGFIVFRCFVDLWCVWSRLEAHDSWDML